MFNNVIMLVLTRLYRRGATLSVIIYFECMEPAKSPPVPLKNDAHTTLGLESRLLISKVIRKCLRLSGT